MADKRWAAMSDDERRELLDWLVGTCLVFGTTRRTAYLVAATLAEALDRG